MEIRRGREGRMTHDERLHEVENDKLGVGAGEVHREERDQSRRVDRCGLDKGLDNIPLARGLRGAILAHFARGPRDSSGDEDCIG